jgi:hypothetical protein
LSWRFLPDVWDEAKGKCPHREAPPIETAAFRPWNAPTLKKETGAFRPGNAPIPNKETGAFRPWNAPVF